MEIEDYESVKKWFTKANGKSRYTPKTEERNIKYMNMFCNLSKMTPDELASCLSINKERDVIASGLERKRLRIYTITSMINALNVFWRTNGRLIDDVYGGIRPELKAKIVLREKATRARSSHLLAP